jgi:hypothetical protein
MLDADLAALYGVVTGNLNLAVRRNEARFPEDFMFQLSRSEADNFDIANCKIKFARWSSNSALCLHQLGVAMLSSVLNTRKAAQSFLPDSRPFPLCFLTR